jgi:UDP-N-acetyl-D-galactosamine dehydrogenase
MVDSDQMEHEYGITLVARDGFRDLDVLILAVPHRETMDTIWEDMPHLVRRGGMVCDLKSVLDSKRLQPDLVYWTL